MIHSIFATTISALGITAAFLLGVFVFTPTPAQVVPSPRLVLDPSVIEARSAILYDAESGEVLFQKNANEQLPLASLTKLMTAQTVLDSQNPDAYVYITSADLVPSGDWGLRPGESMSISDLLKLGLVASSNDAMAAAAASLGADPAAKLNQHARELGLTKSYFLNPTGLDEDETIAGGYGSAYDIARLTAVFLDTHLDYFSQTTFPDVAIDAEGRELNAVATTLPLQNIPGFIGAKTGYTDLAGGNLVAAFDLSIGRPVVVAVLGSSHEGRFADVRTIIEAARESL